MNKLKKLPPEEQKDEFFSSLKIIEEDTVHSHRIKYALESIKNYVKHLEKNQPKEPYEIHDEFEEFVSIHGFLGSWRMNENGEFVLNQQLIQNILAEFYSY